MGFIGSAQAKEVETTNVQFRNKNDLINYLKHVNELYAIAGRPRYGRAKSEELEENYGESRERFNQDNDADNLVEEQWHRFMQKRKPYISKNRRIYF